MKFKMSNSRTWVLVAAIVATLISACAALSPQLTPFYTPPSPLTAAAPGTIIKTEPIETGIPTVRAWRVMYYSRALNGSPSAITGLFAAPTTPPPASGYPLLAVAYGTEGLGRQCAPSLDPWNVPPPLADFISNPDTLVTPFVRAGYAVTLTDYQGLGAPGNSSYLVGTIKAQNVLDSIRAIRAFDEIPLNAQTFVWGHSQGGHAAAFVAQLASQIAPELKFDGFVLSAPTPDTLLTPDGIRQSPALYNDCILNVVAAFGSKPPNTYYFGSPTTTPPWSDIMRLNIAQPTKYAAPVLVVQGTSDQIVAPQITRAFAQSLCAAGNTLQFKYFANSDHLQLIHTSLNDVLAWLDARAKNEPAPSNCDGLPDAPGTNSIQVQPCQPNHLTMPFSDGDITPDAAAVAELEQALPKFLAQNQANDPTTTTFSNLSVNGEA